MAECDPQRDFPLPAPPVPPRQAPSHEASRSCSWRVTSAMNSASKARVIIARAGALDAAGAGAADILLVGESTGSPHSTMDGCSTTPRHQSRRPARPLRWAPDVRTARAIAGPGLRDTGSYGPTSGGGEGNRTPGLDSAIVALYQLSYTPARATPRLAQSPRPTQLRPPSPSRSQPGAGPGASSWSRRCGCAPGRRATRQWSVEGHP